MTKEQEQLHELHVRFKELQGKRHAGALTEDEERELVRVSEDLQAGPYTHLRAHET